MIEYLVQGTEKLNAMVITFSNSAQVQLNFQVVSCDMLTGIIFSGTLQEDPLWKDEDKLMEMLTYKEVEENVMRRVRFKALTFGRVVVTDASPLADLPLKMKPDLVAELYGKWHQGSGSALPPEEAGLGLSFAYLSQATHSPLQFSSMHAQCAAYS
ncbi:hypothetical protein GUJ93_ZPchr0010g9272 [Zizania palustris]|uniref:Uncharacterized protein n=1 Tax=Zizania palustris TaxID=103762 RepID=A0A8J5W6C3_ZIZPA|nr:hypothetical protein GUJ93_ZPchr0010g9272 [Zizania palustris]